LPPQGHENTESVNPRTNMVIFPLKEKERKTRIGKDGKTMKLSFIDIKTLSSVPPLYPAIRPTIVPIIVATTAVVIPNTKEFFNA